MMYPYITLPDETEIVHSQIVTESGKQKVIVNFERSTETGFDSARWSGRRLLQCKSDDYIESISKYQSDAGRDIRE